jgi:hypothetical protein
VSRGDRLSEQLRDGLRAPARLERIEERLARIEAAVAGLANVEAAFARLGEIDSALAEIRGAVRAIAAQETDNRRRLEALRASPEYAAAWTEPRPLVTITVAAGDDATPLQTRSVPSILAQTHAELELIVIGDQSDDALADELRKLRDPRLLFRTLTRRPRLSDDPHRQRLVTLTLARNEAARLARGRWIVCLDEDAAMHHDFLARLLDRAREDRLEVISGRTRIATENREIGGRLPPQADDFTWTSAMYHAGLSFMGRELFAADLGLSGDWYLADRMLRAGVRFGVLQAVICELP